jgi:hypothetical protein
LVKYQRLKNQYLSKAYNQDEIIGSISKKNNNQEKDFEIVKPLGKKETDLLNLLDYSVNLVLSKSIYQ